MSGDKDDLVRNWLIKSARDLLCARELAEATTPLLDSAVYHCQQAAEKAVKGFLIYTDTRFDKTHDVELLTSQASGIEPVFNNYLSAARLLTPYAIEFRYPGDFLEPEPDEFNEALEAAVVILRFVSSLLPTTVTNEMNEVLSTFSQKCA
jgi:HEPN domain-containing protein